MLLSIEVRLHTATGDLRGAEVLLGPGTEGRTSGLAAAAVELAAASGSVARGRKVLDAWPTEEDSLRSRLDLGLWSAVLDDLDGDRRGARRRMAEVVGLAEPEGHVRLFLDAGRDAMRVLRSLFEAEPTPFLRRLVQPERPVSAAAPVRRTALVDPLSERELVVLSYLPSRLSNADIAAQLYVSLNTLKTHLRHVYRKLGVRGRGEAIVAAEQLHLV
jgi:LuxR family transcriptional regulator, maltose regulon positive regulatory protein